MENRVKKRSKILFISALCLQGLFFLENYYSNHLYPGKTLLFQDPGFLGAYNFAHYSTFNSQEGICRIGYTIQGAGVFHHSAKKPRVQDTVGYAVVLGLLWKITHHYSLYYVIIFQILVFAFLIMFFYKALVLLLKNDDRAYAGSWGLLLFLPFLFFNVQPVKDVYLLYGLLILWITAAYFFYSEKNRIILLLIGSSSFALCQWVRTPLFGALVLFTFLLCLFKSIKLKKRLHFLIIFWGLNIVVFWFPFMVFNKTTYDRYFVGCAGQGLFEGIGEFENKWGIKLSDSWFKEYITSKYPGLQNSYGTPEFDDAAKKEFWQVFKEDPLLFFKNIVKRIPYYLSCSLSFSSYVMRCDRVNWRAYSKLKSLGGKVHFFRHRFGFSFEAFLFLFHMCYSKIIWLLAFLGLLLCCYKGIWFLLLLFVSTYIGSIGLIISHTECRYVYPVMPLYGILVGLFFHWFFLKIKNLQDFRRDEWSSYFLRRNQG